MRADEYARCDALALTALIEAGEVSAAEVDTAARAAVAALNPDLNFLAGALFEPEERQEATGPFGGVPTLIKDIGAAMAGVPQEMGSRLAQGMRAVEDSTLVKRMRDSGLNIIGRSTTPELGSAFTTESRATGATRNPWDTSRSTGGSSGGAAAAVAAGAVPIAHAGDSAGSIRIPAHCCGVFGLKPSRGRLPVGPQSGEANGGLTAGHVITRTVRDSAAALDALAGPDAGCRYTAPPPDGRFLDAAERPPEPLRIALCTASPIAGAVQAEVTDAAEETARLCQSMGHKIDLACPVFDPDAFIDMLIIIWSANIHHAVRRIEAATGRMANEDTLEGVTLALSEHGRTITSEDYLLSLDAMNAFSRAMAAQMGAYDAVISPVFASTAPELGALAHDRRVDDLRAFFADLFGHAPFTVQYNLTGQPAFSAPLSMSADGLPIGVQVAAPMGREETLFSLAGALEAARPWRDRLPPVHASSFTERRS